MKIIAASLAKVTTAFQPNAFKRIILLAHLKTPLGTGLNNARFSSVDKKFGTLYAASTLATAIAETIVRDRFEGSASRRLFSPEIEGQCVVDISASTPLHLVDLRKDGCFQLGVSTDIASAKGWKDSRELAQAVHDHTGLDGFLYRSRLTGDNCVAVFDRAVTAKLTAGTARALSATPQLAGALDKLNVEVIL